MERPYATHDLGALVGSRSCKLVNIVCGLIAYCYQPKKPAIAIDHNLLSAA
ncbi:MAG: hypothetical protein V7K89_11895 [Nostoc sp.]|uniref:hypothetical protein n=1 Tax=Nostoc sp. TaxID=1180 RepID=UPI002FFB2080